MMEFLYFPENKWEYVPAVMMTYDFFLCPSCYNNKN
ncbi:hypothetical protein CA207_07500 [Macrococcoides caseolyticum]|nr:hypothetical protein CA207_07490 [Macrococcus caseolyticus]ARQ04005.1 hypothetical protein CA207_07500 [Macrococcus caseolyticus]